METLTWEQTREVLIELGADPELLPVTWRPGISISGCGAVLVGQDLSGLYLHSTDMGYMDLRWCVFNNTNLTRANLGVCDIKWADFREAITDEAEFLLCAYGHAMFNRDMEQRYVKGILLEPSGS